jgi:hypothetical protein
MAPDRDRPPRAVRGVPALLHPAHGAGLTAGPPTGPPARRCASAHRDEGRRARQARQCARPMAPTSRKAAGSTGSGPRATGSRVGLHPQQVGAGRGAIEAYTEGAEITPKRSPWLWISTDEIPRRAGRYRMTPALYRATGLESRIGPLVQIPGRHRGEALLIVRNVTVDRFGRRGKARRLPKRGAVGAAGSAKLSSSHSSASAGPAGPRGSIPRQIISLEQARLPEYRQAVMASDGFER